MASQMHVAFSKDVIGAGIMSGGPYFCAMNHKLYAKFACTTSPYLIDVKVLKRYTDHFSKQGDIDDTINLKNSKVWIFGGTNDTMIDVGVAKKVKEFYLNYIPQENIVSLFDTPAAHGFITNHYGNQCGIYSWPYVNNCQIDAAGEILSLIYGSLTPKTQQNLQNLVEFNQTAYGITNAGFADTGYKYIPANCKTKPCRIHMVLHGCAMSYDYLGSVFIANAGYNEWAESNDIIIIYPQAQRWTDINPHACWDGFGLSGPDYALKSGIQMSILYKMSQDSNNFPSLS
mmetsp:Transcript_502/g.538  ORF Transcript_502/g.538 Transcript_502/m.538 type:complete len:287 (+) Transcript_502:128-988(+)